MANKEAKARIRINELLQRAGWRFFNDANGPANISLEANVKLDSLGDDFEKTANGFIDYLLLDERGFPIAVLEAKRESLDPLVSEKVEDDYIAITQNANHRNDPREWERRQLLDTYKTVGCASGIPTFRYSLIDGVKDGELVEQTFFGKDFEKSFSRTPSK